MLHTLRIQVPCLPSAHLALAEQLGGDALDPLYKSIKVGAPETFVIPLEALVPNQGWMIEVALGSME